MDLNETYFSEKGQEQLKKDLIQFYTKEDPLLTYACLSSLYKAAREACQEVSSDAIAYALDPANKCQPLAGEGKHFTHLGLTFAIQYSKEYNYNQGDETGKLWQTTVNEIASLEARKKALTQKKNGYQSVILVNHPRLQPTNVSMTFKYIAAKSSD